MSGWGRHPDDPGPSGDDGRYSPSRQGRAPKPGPHFVKMTTKTPGLLGGLKGAERRVADAFIAACNGRRKPAPITASHASIARAADVSARTVVEGAWSLTGLKHDQNEQFDIIGSLGTSFNEVKLIAGTSSGIKETKQFQLSGITTVPETSTWAMMLLGFAGLAYAGFRKTKGARAALSAG